MTDIAIPDQQPTPGVDLELWARQAQSAGVYAAAVCSTLMAPAAYRGKPAEATAAILAGAELGFSPMASLRAFDNIQGVPAPKAMTLRAVVQAAGHEVVIVESTATRAEVTGRRRGDEKWQTSVWDIPRARLMPQYEKNPNYKQNPAAMLVARATAEVCRWIAADAIMGMPYAAEEAGDFEPAAAAPVTRRLTVAELDESTAPRVHPVDGRELTAGYMADPEADEKAAAFPGYVDPTTLVVPHITDQQRKAMFALWADLGYGGDENRQTRLDLIARFIGAKAVESSNDLTAAEADTVIAKLVERKARMVAPDA